MQEVEDDGDRVVLKQIKNARNYQNIEVYCGRGRNES